MIRIFHYPEALAGGEHWAIVVDTWDEHAQLVAVVDEVTGRFVDMNPRLLTVARGAALRMLLSRLHYPSAPPWQMVLAVMRGESVAFMHRDFVKS